MKGFINKNRLKEENLSVIKQNEKVSNITKRNYFCKVLLYKCNINRRNLWYIICGEKIAHKKIKQFW